MPSGFVLTLFFLNEIIKVYKKFSLKLVRINFYLMLFDALVTSKLSLKSNAKSVAILKFPV